MGLWTEKATAKMKLSVMVDQVEASCTRWGVLCVEFMCAPEFTRIERGRENWAKLLTGRNFLPRKQWVHGKYTKSARYGFAWSTAARWWPTLNLFYSCVFVPIAHCQLPMAQVINGPMHILQYCTSSTGHIINGKLFTGYL